MSTCARQQLLQQGSEYDVAMLQITGLASPASVRRFKDQQVYAGFQDFHQESNLPLESYEEPAFPVIRSFPTKLPSVVTLRRKWLQSIFAIAIPLLGSPKNANALNTTPNDGTIPEITPNKPKRLALRLYTVFSSPRLSCSLDIRNTATGVSYPSHPSHSQHCYGSRGDFASAPHVLLSDWMALPESGDLSE